MIPIYAELLNDLTQKVNDENIKPEEKISITKDLLHDIRINKVTNFFLNNEDRIRRFYGDLENLKEERFVNIISPKATFNFFNEYLDGMMTFIETQHNIESLGSIIEKSTDFINTIFTKDENSIGVSVKQKMDSLNDYIWFHNIGCHIIEDVIEKFERTQYKSCNEHVRLITLSIINFSIKYIDLCESNFIELEQSVKPV